MGNNRFVAIWGSGGSGKTLLTVKFAKELAAQKKNVLIIHCDDETPVLPLVLPVSENIKSLGNLLAMSNSTQVAVLQHCTVFGSSGYISLLGYKLGENAISYREYSSKDVKNLFNMCRQIPTVDYILVDCSHHTIDNVLTIVALETADAVIKVSNSNIKSTVYIESQKKLLREERFHYCNQINVLNNVLPSQDTYPFREALGGAPYVLSHCSSLEEQYHERKLLDSLYGKAGKKFESVIKQLVKEVFFDE